MGLLNGRPDNTISVGISLFGLGSLGKLVNILSVAPELNVELNLPRHSREYQMIAERFSVVDRLDFQPRVALVINDPTEANRLVAAGQPTVYVDSLPYLWARESEVPADVAVYCAQRFGGDLPAGSPLCGRSVRWIDPITPVTSRVARSRRGIVVNVGGLHSHLSAGAEEAYIRHAVLPVLAALRAAGSDLTAVCGKLPDGVVEEVEGAAGRDVAIGLAAPEEFATLLSRSAWLYTSPGSTTILQAARLRTPTVLLPPQNLSQVLNAQLLGARNDCVISWPDTVIPARELSKARPHGEDACLRIIYDAIVNRGASARSHVYERTMSSIRALDRGQTAINEATLNRPSEGSRQVARLLRQALFAPLLV